MRRTRPKSYIATIEGAHEPAMLNVEIRKDIAPNTVESCALLDN